MKRAKGRRRSLQRHASRRLAERFGLLMEPGWERAVVRRIQTGDRAVFVEKQSHRRTVWDIQLADGRVARVVYDKKAKALVTVLYPNLEAA